MGRHEKAEAAPEVELPITPMLDMAFQLLTFFVFTYHPSALEGQIEMMLPKSAEAMAKAPEDVDPNKASDDEKDPELASELTIIIKAQAGGDNPHEPQHYLVEAREGPTRLETKEQLEEYLVKAREGLTNKDDIKIRADSRLKYVYIMQVMDICHNPKKGGFKRVGFGPPPDSGGGS